MNFDIIMIYFLLSSFIVLNRYRILVYLKYCFSGLAFPPGMDLSIFVLVLKTLNGIKNLEHYGSICISLELNFKEDQPHYFFCYVFFMELNAGIRMRNYFYLQDMVNFLLHACLLSEKSCFNFCWTSLLALIQV